MVAAAPGWHLGDLYAIALAAVGVTVLIGVGAMSHRHERAFSASVLYVRWVAPGPSRCPRSTCVRSIPRPTTCCWSD